MEKPVWDAKDGNAISIVGRFDTTCAVGSANTSRADDRRMEWLWPSNATGRMVTTSIVGSTNTAWTNDWGWTGRAIMG